jgi:hypothetical protein
MDSPHWYVRPWPNLGLAVCGLLPIVIFQALGIEPAALVGAGVLVGLLDGVLEYLGRRAVGRELHRARNFGEVLFTYAKSPWTRVRNLTCLAALLVTGAILVPRTHGSAVFATVYLFCGYTSSSFALRALVAWLWRTKYRRPLVTANNALERTRDE